MWLAGAAWLFSAVAMALTLDEAKQQGRVGETLSGYIAPVKQDAETLALVKRINAGRAEKYQEVADGNHIAVDEVARMAGQKLVTRAQSGEYVRGINGQWLQKARRLARQEIRIDDYYEGSAGLTGRASCPAGVWHPAQGLRQQPPETGLPWRLPGLWSPLPGRRRCLPRRRTPRR